MSESERHRPRVTGIPRFFHWWRDELSAVMPAFLLRPLLHLQQSLEVHLGEDGVRVLQRSGAKTAELGTYPAAEESTSDVETDVRRMDRRRTPVTVHVPERLTLSRLLELPGAAMENLRQVLDFEMDRQTPFRAEDVFYSFQVIERGSADKRVRVELRLVPRVRVMEALGPFKEWDLKAVDVASAEGGGGLCIRLSSRDFRQDGAGVGKGLPLIVNSVLLVALVAIPFRQQYNALDTLGEKLSEVQRRAEVTQSLKQRLEQSIAEARFLVEQKNSTPAVVTVLNELSVLLPDTTWLTRMEIAGGEVNIHGTSQAASALIGLLEISPRFENAHFSSPVTQNPSGNRERFQLTVNQVPGEAR